MSSSARDIMTTPVVSVGENQTLQEVIALMDRHNISGLPVADENGVLTGIISNTDIINYSQKVNVVPLFDLSGWISPHTEIEDLASLRLGIDQLARTKVGQLMKQKVYTAGEDTPLLEIARLMSRRQVNRIPIIDRHGKLTGIITRADMVRSIAGSD